MNEQKVLNYKLKTPQYEFLNSIKKYPAYVGSWATGKSMTAIFKSVKISELYKDNLGIIFRKEFTDLRDSTMQDFNLYTGLKPQGEEKSVIFPNGSKILFRHLEELNNLQNINLGWFWIEQAEELETDHAFFMLQGRLRRANCSRQGFITANTKGDNWIKKLWKDSPKEEYPLFEMTTLENTDILPPDYIESLKDLAINKPAIYNRYVMNSWEEDDVTDFIIRNDQLKLCINKEILSPRDRILISCDPARFGDDETVIYIFNNYKLKFNMFLKGKSTTEVSAELASLANKYRAKVIVIDEIGLGAGVVDRTRELAEHSRVIGVNSAVNPDNLEDKKHYLNLRAKMWDTVSKIIAEQNINIPDEPELIKQLTSVRYSFKLGKMKIEDKSDIKKRLGRSPDRADAYVQGIYYMQYCPISAFEPRSLLDDYQTERRAY